MSSFFRIEKNRLVWDYNHETLWLEPWGKDGLRIRSTVADKMDENDWALLAPEKRSAAITEEESSAKIVNGKISAVVTAAGKITFYNQAGTVLLEEFVRNRRNVLQDCSALELEAREFKPAAGKIFRITVRFESEPEEKLYGMGQYQQEFLNLKNCSLELAQRNSQASVPFLLSNLGYGFLWNNPAVGKAVFSKNITEWTALSSAQIDYWITAGDTPAEIEQNYAAVTGTVPMMPEYAMGLWQCKLRYQTQEELLAVAREYKQRHIPLSVIVIDYFHWTKQGEWKFDPEYWPDPDGMIKELKDMGIELMVSVWPTVDKTSENYGEMMSRGYLVRTDRGIRTTMDYLGDTVFFDATNPAAEEFVWKKIKQNYYDRGIRLFWLDEAEPEYSVYDYDLYRYHTGPVLQVGNIYPFMYAKTFFDGMSACGQQQIINLVRCAWAGSQRFGALVWSGDIYSSFKVLRRQLCAGLNMGLAGIPWWTTDIGGFHGGNPDDPAFRELIIRWFQFATFCPVLRMHGDREPHTAPLGTEGGGLCPSGAANEIWCYGGEAYNIFRKYILIREGMKPYITECMKAAHEKGTPVMRPLFYDFPEDGTCWTVSDEYMFGPSLLVAPVLYAGMRKRSVYLPAGTHWKIQGAETQYDGGQKIECSTPIDTIPVFLKID